MRWFNVNEFRTRLHQPWFGSRIGAVLVALAGVCLLLFPFGKGLRDWSYDLPFLLRLQKGFHTNIVIIYLDEKTYRQLGQAPYDFDRGLHAQLLQNLKTNQARMAVFDLLFIDTNRSPTLGDTNFAQAMRDWPHVVIGAQFHYDQNFFKNAEVRPPMDLFRDAAAGWGAVRVDRDPDFGARLHDPGTALVKSLAWRAAEIAGSAATKDAGSRLNTERWLNYYSPAPFQGISYADALTGNLPKEFSFKDKIVFIGSGDVAGYGGEEKEQFRYPWTWLSGHFPLGVEVHALTFNNLLRQDWLRRLPLWIEILLMATAGGLLGYGLSLLRPLAATATAILVAILVSGAAWLLFKYNLWYPWMIVVGAQLPITLAWSYLFSSIKTYLETRLLETSLALYLSPPQVKQILKQPALLKPGGKEATVSILFSDIANFSRISELKANPNDLVDLLNKYYAAALAIVHDEKGTVMNLIGDAIFAIWNAPQEQLDHQQRACRAAVRLSEQLLRFDAEIRDLQMRTRIGLHTGRVCVGNIGDLTHFDYTAIGKSVNLASRLEGLNKQLGTQILATRDIQKAVQDSMISLMVGHFRFKGFYEPIEVYELIGPAAINDDTTKPWRDTFASALCDFQRKKFSKSEQGFRNSLALRPQTEAKSQAGQEHDTTPTPEQFYLDQIAQLRLNPPPTDWLGEIDLRHK